MDFKHVCKFCKRRFPCGRSLGGHIRSHLIHNNNNSCDAPNEEPELQKPGSGPGYELRENPKKTNKAADLLNSPLSSWSTESKTVYGSDPIPSNQKRSPAWRSSFIGGNNSHSSVSEVVEPEQEEVAIAMCLIMLSRDGGNWGNISSSVAAGFSDDISLLQVNKTRRRSRREKTYGRDSAPGNTSIVKKSKNLEFAASGQVQNGSKMKEFEVSANGFPLNDETNKPSESKYSVSGTSNHTCGSKNVEPAPSGHLQNGGKMKEFEVSANGFSPLDQNNKPSQNKRKVDDVRNGSEMKEFEVSEDGFALNDQKSNHHGLNFDETAMNSELLFHNSSSNNKRSKFECTTCNKVFHSYQALGGHRASHKKLLGVKSSPVLKLGNNIVNGQDHLPPPPHPPAIENDQQRLVAGIVIGSSSSSSKKVVQKHECPICFRVFPSGQALGGHKRSHLLAANNNNNGSSLIESSSSPENRDLLDLNLPPAPAEEETASGSDSLVGLIKPYWWVKSSKHEPIWGLISN